MSIAWRVKHFLYIFFNKCIEPALALPNIDSTCGDLPGITGIDQFLILQTHTVLSKNLFRHGVFNES